MPGYYFNLPPITQLTIPQQAALNETRQIALSGGPGTGKSVVSLWRHISNYQRNPIRNSLLLTFNTTLKVYLAECCNSVRNDRFPNAGRLSSQYVGSSIKNLYKIRNTRFSEVIIDEAQDLSNDYFNDIISPVSYGADDSQILYPDHCSTQSQLRTLFPTNVSCVLDKNFRSTQRIMKFARQAFPNAVIPQRIIDGLANNVGELPVLLISNGGTYDRTNSKQNDAIERIIDSFHADDHNIAILVPWKSDVNVFEEVLNDKGIEYSLYYEDKERFPDGCERISNIHLTTFKSAKGLEFDTVIVPNFHKYEEICGQFNTHWQDFYVACTRARSNLYLISNYDLPDLELVTDKEEL